MNNFFDTWHVIRRSLTIARVFLGFRLYEYLSPSPLRSCLHIMAFVVPRAWQYKIRHADLATRTAQAFQELGPVAIKLGQMLSTRHDLINSQTAQALSTLQDKMPFFPTAQAQAIIAQSFGTPLDQLFCRFDETPLAAASIAQIHTARLSKLASQDQLEHEVIIKIIRPGIQKAILAETKVLRAIATIANRFWPNIERFHVLKVVDNYETTILDECDLRLEAANTQRFFADFKDSELLYVPHIFTPWIQKDVFIMERVSGLPVNDIRGLKQAGVRLDQLSEIGATIFLTQVFKNNFFHADMHPGNILVDITNPAAPKYIALDCAIAGSLNARDHKLLARQLLALIKQDYLRLARLLITGRWVPADTQRLALAAALEEVCSPILSKPLSEIEFGPLLAKLFSTAREFELQALPQFVLLEKTLLHVEGLGRQLDPDLDIWSLGQPLLTRWLRNDLLAPENALKAPNHVINLLEKLPETVEDWHDQQMGLRQTGTEALGARLKRLELNIAQQTKQAQRRFFGTCIIVSAIVMDTHLLIEKISPLSIIAGLLGLILLFPRS